MFLSLTCFVIVGSQKESGHRVNVVEWEEEYTPFDVHPLLLKIQPTFDVIEYKALDFLSHVELRDAISLLELEFNRQKERRSKNTRPDIPFEFSEYDLNFFPFKNSQEEVLIYALCSCSTGGSSNFQSGYEVQDGGPCYFKATVYLDRKSVWKLRFTGVA